MLITGAAQRLPEHDPDGLRAATRSGWTQQGVSMVLRQTEGFTLIELITVSVIIGLLAAIALPKFTNTKEKAAIAAMKSDLRNLAAAEETYFADNLQYSMSPTAIDLRQSENVTVTIPVADVGGWRATAAHTASSVTCELYTGTATGASTATEDGVLACN